jgi:predicted AAA+ superfamily ATPase
MLTDAKILEILTKWNFWEKTSIDAGFPREITGDILTYIDSPEIIVLKGVRRSGKSTILFQMMNSLLAKGVRSKDILYVNFEEPLFIEYNGRNILERLYKVYKEQINPRKFSYIFLDEVQEAPEWEKWVRAKTELKEAKIAITGSSSKLLSTEFSTLLTGRNVSFAVYPLSFRELLYFKGIRNTLDSIFLTKNKSLIKNFLGEYMQFGGFPEIVLKETPEMKEKLLKQYFEDILYRDVVWRYKIRDIATLKNIALLYMTNISNLSSYNKIKNALDVPLDVVRNYSSYLSETYLVKEVMKHSFKVKEQLRNPKKVYTVDTGLRNAVSYRFSEDLGRIAENIVFLTLLRQDKDIYYYKNNREIDFLVRKGVDIENLIQVCMTNIENSKAIERELNSIEEGMSGFKISNGIIITEDWEENIKCKKGMVTAVPLWKWLI